MKNIKLMQNKEKFSYIFSICGLVVIIAFLICLYYSGVLFACKTDLVSSIPIGTTTRLVVENSNSSVATFDLNGAVLPGENIQQNINIFNNGQDNLRVRAIAFIYTKDRGKVDLELNVSDFWIKDADGYYYYKDKVTAKETISLTDKIKLSDLYVFNSSERYIINILVESLDSDLDVNSIWHTEIFE